jgi:dTDP-4-amino-4,6-dideoxygalactose transaminase
VIPFSYLQRQFSDTEAEAIWAKVKPVVLSGDFTLGSATTRFEEAYALKAGTKYAIGVNSGTDALALPLIASGIRGEVIVPAHTFFASAGAIVQAGATPVFCDVGNDMNLDPARVLEKITPRTEAILPVMWGGRPCDMTAFENIANQHGLAIYGDCAQALGSDWNGLPVGFYGHAAGYSLHPLKMVNCWGDGGVITTDDGDLAAKIKKLRNHGMVNRDTIDRWGYNSRLDTVQAVVSMHVLADLDHRVDQRRMFAHWLIDQLKECPGISIAPEHDKAYMNYYLFTFTCQDRDQLYAHLHKHSVDCKVHYPIPLHLQPAAAKLGHSSLDPAYRCYQRGDFPQAEYIANNTISLPCHEYLEFKDAVYMANCIKEFYADAANSRVA